MDTACVVMNNFNLGWNHLSKNKLITCCCSNKTSKYTAKQREILAT